MEVKYQDGMAYVLMLRNAGVTQKKILDVMENTPRDFFIEQTFSHRAYEDVALPIAAGQTISQPSIVGKMTQALDLQPSNKVLEIGTGSGYHATILSHLCRRVYTVERHTSLARVAQQRFRALRRSNITLIQGDGTLGLPLQAPFDRIILTAAAEDPPPNLLAQMKIGAIMVLPIGRSDNVQTLIKVTKTQAGYEYDELEKVRFVPLVAG